jgi:hypothetical protein
MIDGAISNTNAPLQKLGDITIAFGNTVYTARGFFKPAGKTLSEKLLRNMEKDLQIEPAIVSGNFGENVIKYE